MSHHATPAGAGAQAAAELARRLSQGCTARRVATAAGLEPGREPSKKRAPNVGKLGEKTADGRPKPDERTVADLVRRGWFVLEEAAVALLTRRKTNLSRYVFETAESAADWLEATLGPEPVKDGLCPAAKAVKRDPNLLYRDADTVQRRWDALTLSPERGGVGIAFSTEQAREAVRKHPPLLSCSVETYKTGWSMLTDEKDGMGLPHEKARTCILRSPAVLRFDNDKVVRRVALLKSLGYEEARAMALRQPHVLMFKEETAMEAAAWWKRSGLDHVKLVTANPTLLDVKELQTNLDFLRHVAKLSVADLNLWTFFYCQPRLRFFYALKHGALERYKLSSLVCCTDACFLRRVHQLDALAHARKIAEYKQEVASTAFQAWSAQEEARRL